MYVCICNALTERHVDDAVASGADHAAQVYRHHACEARCGKCVSDVRDRIRDRRDDLPNQQGLPVLSD